MPKNVSFGKPPCSKRSEEGTMGPSPMDGQVWKHLRLDNELPTVGAGNWTLSMEYKSSGEMSPESRLVVDSARATWRPGD
jgi:hypothetical protein